MYEDLGASNGVTMNRRIFKTGGNHVLTTVLGLGFLVFLSTVVPDLIGLLIISPVCIVAFCLINNDQPHRRTIDVLPDGRIQIYYTYYLRSDRRWIGDREEIQSTAIVEHYIGMGDDFHLYLRFRNGVELDLGSCPSQSDAIEQARKIHAELGIDQDPLPDTVLRKGSWRRGPPYSQIKTILTIPGAYSST